MKITVKLFAILKDRAGVGEVVLELNDGVSISSAADALKSKFPSLCDFLPRVAYAVNREYMPADTKLRDGDELAIIPPVSGG